MSLRQRLQLHHPETVWRKWQAAARAARTTPPSNRKHMEILRLQEELDAGHPELRQLKKGRDDLTEGDWTWRDTPDDIATAMPAAYPGALHDISALEQD
jgi:hypothetical protein